MGKSYARRGVTPPRNWEPRKGDVVYIQGHKTAIKRVGVSDGVPYVWFTRSVDGTTAMSVGNLRQVAYVEDRQSNPTIPKSFVPARVRRLKNGQLHIEIVRNPVKRTGKHSGRAAMASWPHADTSARGLLRRKSSVKRSRRRYYYGVAGGAWHGEARTHEAAKNKAAALARKRGAGGFWVQNTITGSILSYSLNPRRRR
jgi:hypothetical protein